jgi:hypothetical protein
VFFEIFRSFSSLNLENTFQSFFQGKNKFGKRVLKYLFKDKSENLGGRKETQGWEEEKFGVQPSPNSKNNGYRGKTVFVIIDSFLFYEQAF